MSDTTVTETASKGRGPTVQLPVDSLVIQKPRKNETVPETARQGRGVSEVQQKLRSMVAGLEANAWFKLPMQGEKKQRALISHLRNAVTNTHEGMSIGVATDETHVWFRIQAKSNRGRKPKEG